MRAVAFLFAGLVFLIVKVSYARFGPNTTRQVQSENKRFIAELSQSEPELLVTVFRMTDERKILEWTRRVKIATDSYFGEPFPVYNLQGLTISGDGSVVIFSPQRSGLYLVTKSATRNLVPEELYRKRRADLPL